jgi:myosin-crossreactive antigen
MTSRQWIDKRLEALNYSMLSDESQKHITALAMLIADSGADFSFDEHGIVQNHGKFEREYIATVWFYDVFMDGGGGYVNERLQDFDMTDSEKLIFNFSERRYLLDFRDDGFVIGQAI